MKKIFYIIVLCFTLLLSSFTKELCAQKVGLVLSGGGSKGIAHVGVLKALEDMEVPIDYIAGTSMGAIIGGLYAIGYSPREIEVLVSSDEFQNWAIGKTDEKYSYYFKKSALDASWMSFNFNYDSIWQYNIPTNFVSTDYLDFAFMNIFSSASPACDNNFDSLFIPFRCVAADVAAREAVVFKDGNVSDAIRASMTYPLYFKPIRINGKLLFDGGLYNNFPSDVVYTDFFPDIIIGSNVSGNAPLLEDNIGSQVENLLMRKTNYSVICDNGVMISPKAGNPGLIDFSGARELIFSGYMATLEKMDDIRSFVADSVSIDTRDKQRKQFLKKKPDIYIDNIIVTGITEKQTNYISRHLTHNKTLLRLDEIQPEYYKLLSDEFIDEIFPKSKYNKNTGFYDLFLKVKKENNFLIQFGGNVSSSPVNEAYIGIKYKNLGRNASSISANSYFGHFYSSVQMRGRIDFPKKKPFYLESVLTYNHWDYFKTSSYFFEDKMPSFLVQNENHCGINAGIPSSNTGKIETGISSGQIRDDYYQSNYFRRDDIPDRTYFDFIASHVLYERNTLNKKQFANKGTMLSGKMQYIYGTEFYQPGTTTQNTHDIITNQHKWLQIKMLYESYSKPYKKYTLGISGSIIFSNKELFNNYTASSLSANIFAPTPESKTLFLPVFRANRYATAGIKNIILLNKNIEFRNCFYYFQPYREIKKNPSSNEAYLGNRFDASSFIISNNIILHNALGPISISANYYHNSENPFSFVFNFGYIIYNKKSLQ